MASPDVSVVIATFNRAQHLERLLDALRHQSHPLDRFEVVVVDDGSGDGTASLLDREAARGELRLVVVRREENGGRARAREDGWRAAKAELIAFTDDDCEPDPQWLELGLKACAEDPGAIVQGRTEPKRDEREATGPFSRPFTRTITVTGLDAGFQTCNIFYPRGLLERVDGFDVGAFRRVHGGEDADLAWRAIATGARPVFAGDARVYHAVNRLGPIGKLRLAARWEMKAYARHRGLRRAHFVRGIFWKGSHYLLLRAVLATLLPKRWRLIRAWLAAPYAAHLAERGRVEGGGLLLAPYFVLHDLIEICAVARAGIRYRTPML